MGTIESGPLGAYACYHTDRNLEEKVIDYNCQGVIENSQVVGARWSYFSGIS
jgi:hypothetical protein